MFRNSVPHSVGEIALPVTREEAVYAYRLILGREPESELVIEHAMLAENIAELRGAFLGCEEFIKKQGHAVPQHLPIGRFIDSSDCQVDLECTPDQRAAMFERIGRAWQAFGESEPHWSVLVSDDFRQDRLAANLDRFYASASGDIEVAFGCLRRAGLSTSFGKALDFGCGVGRLSLTLAKHADHVTGIDISPPHLRLAAERARDQKIENVGFEAITSVDDLDRFRGFDFVLSLIVLQHNPPPVMAALYEKLLQTLAPGGVSIIQMPTFIAGQDFSVPEYLANEQPQMEMNALPQNIVFEIIERAGCRALEVREDGYTGHHAIVSHIFVVQKKA